MIIHRFEYTPLERTSCLQGPPRAMNRTDLELESLSLLPVGHYAPRVATIPLPPDRPTTTNSFANDLYPLQISADATFPRQLRLSTIRLKTPVHIHTPFAHIGILDLSHASGGDITALDTYLYLHTMIKKPIDYDATFAPLPQELQTLVKNAFFRRNASVPPRDSVTSWQRFLLRNTSYSGVGGPAGYDLLLGNDQVWGFEGCSQSGISIMHVCSPVDICTSNAPMFA